LTVVVLRRLRWIKRSSNKVLSTTASRQSWSYAEQGQIRTGELWPRRHAHDGGAAGREEEEQRTGVPGEIK